MRNVQTNSGLWLILDRHKNLERRETNRINVVGCLVGAILMLGPAVCEWRGCESFIHEMFI